MILIDFNQIVIASLVQQVKGSMKLKIEEDLVRHMVLNSLRSYISKFKREYGEIVVCCDNKTYWRKNIFPYYKAHRSKARSKSDLDWSLIFSIIEKIRNELKEYLPYKVLEVSGAEADDIIATLVAEVAPLEKVLIVSSDKDFQQLMKYPNVEQWSPILKDKIVCYNPETFLKEHIIRGDKGDGIPNILSSGDTFVRGIRSKSLNNSKVDQWKTEEPAIFCENETILSNYMRNKMLIDMDEIPKEIRESILTAYNNKTTGNKQKMLNYFISTKLTNLIGSLDEF